MASSARQFEDGMASSTKTTQSTQFLVQTLRDVSSTVFDNRLTRTSLNNLLQSVGLPTAVIDNQGPSSNGQPVVCLPAMETLFATFLICTLGFLTCLHQWQKRRKLSRQLKEAQTRLHYLHEKLRIQDNDVANTVPATFMGGSPQRIRLEDRLTPGGVPSNGNKKTAKKEIRIFMDGAFDLLHYGHMNAFRLARSLGTQLIVGVNSDESIAACKGGAPLMKDHERLTMVSACKFVDEVVPGCPYIMTREYIDYVINTLEVDYVIHGDDPCLVDGKDVYEAAKQAGKFQTIPRTEGVSTTDIVGRMLLMTKEHHCHNQNDDMMRGKVSDATSGRQNKSLEDSLDELLMVGGQHSKFLTTSRMLQLFSAGVKAPSKDMHVVYIDGAWDLFHPGHVTILKAARERGDYLIVGVHSDAVVNKVRGMNLPLMNLHERVLSVLGCRYVDDVLIDAPYEISTEMIAHLNISEVVRGTVRSDLGNTQQTDARYKYAKEAGIFTILPSHCDFSIGSVVRRIQRNQAEFQDKFERKMEKERSFYREKRRSNGSIRS